MCSRRQHKHVYYIKNIHLSNSALCLIHCYCYILAIESWIESYFTALYRVDHKQIIAKLFYA